MTPELVLSLVLSGAAVVMSVASFFVNRSNRRETASSDECQCGHGKCFHHLRGTEECAELYCHCQLYIPKNEPVAELPGAKVIALPGRRDR
jgi:hypothetical protein